MASMPDLKQNFPEWEELNKKIEAGKTVYIPITKQGDHLKIDERPSEIVSLIYDGYDVKLIDDISDEMGNRLSVFHFAQQVGNKVVFTGWTDGEGVLVQYNAYVSANGLVQILPNY